ncbi:unnamed protein product [Timema podura]|uniref:Alpha-2-macroglobulin domain-containing protein n=1 Tax=Timema podura TaxID=61482 RepID=A0ABN7P9G1_TIMPD|nr:unnamed protein product [Timema podura]
MPADAGAFMGIHAQRSASYFMQAGNDISKSRVVDSFFLFENFTRSEPKVVWKSREGLVPDESVYLTSMNDGVDTNQTFTLANLAVFTDAHVPARPRTEVCDTKEGYVPCFTEGCFLESKKCDGHKDCEDGSDENGCVFQDDQYEYRVLRRSISSELYDVIGKEWGWQEMNGEYGGEEFFRMTVPPIIDDYYFTAFSVSKTLGFTSSGEPVPFSTVRPFMMHLEGPSACHRGEQVGLRLLLLNNEPYEMLVLITLHSSPHYKFVHVEMNGIVTSYGARLEGGDHQHMVYVC